MTGPKGKSLIVLLMTLPLAAISCDEPDESTGGHGVPEEPAGVEVAEAEMAVAPGDEVLLRFPNDSTLRAIAVGVARSDGTMELAIFRGPTKLADVITGGTFVFPEDSLPSRVRRLQPGEELHKANR